MLATWASAAVGLSSHLANATLTPAQVDVAIVGGGWSGLVAAATICEHNQKAAPANRLTFHILEATDHAGGRTLNKDVVTNATSVSGDDVVELGGEWLAPTHTHAIAMAESLGFDLFHRPYNLRRAAEAAGADEGSTQLRLVLHTSAGTRYATTQQQMLGLLPPLAQEEVRNVSAAFKALAQTVSCGHALAGLSAEQALALDGTTYGGWLRQMGISEEAANWLSEFADDAEETNAMSLLGVLWTYNCSDDLVGAPTEDWWRVRGGTQGPALALARRLAAHLTLSAPVTAVSADRDAAGKEVQLVSYGQEAGVAGAVGVLRARRVLMAGLSTSALLGVRFEPPLPRDTAQLLARLPLGTSLKFMLVYETPWWRARGFLGKIDTTNYPAAGSGVRVSPYVSECLDNSPASCSGWGAGCARGVIMCFVEGRQNRAFFRDLPSAAQRRAHVADFVAFSFNASAAAPPPLFAIEHNWADEPYTRGAYASFFPPGVLAQFWPTWAQMIQEHRLGGAARPLWIAGSDYSGNGMGYIDGAIQSGRAAAQRMITAALEERAGATGAEGSTFAVEER